MNKFLNHLKRFNHIKKELFNESTFLNHIKRFNLNKFNSKKYENEKVIITFTSWRKRINYVYKTLETLINQTIKCHVVLVLSSDEFPQKEKELPESLLMMLDYFEILWVKENTKAFKKVYPTIVKYQNLDVPILSADDDCSYFPNYAEEMLDFFNKEGRDCFVRYNGIKGENFYNRPLPCVGGPFGLYPPCYFKYLINYYYEIMRKKDMRIINKFGDDSNAFVIKKFRLKIKILYEYCKGKELPRFPFYFNDNIDNNPLHPEVVGLKNYTNAIKKLK